MSAAKTVRRILHFKFTLPTADNTQFLAMMKNNTSYKTIFGEVHMRFLQNTDNPARILQIVEYDMPEEIESRRQAIASDPRIQAYLQAWRSIMPDVQVDVYREIEDRA